MKLNQLPYLDSGRNISSRNASLLFVPLMFLAQEKSPPYLSWKIIVLIIDTQNILNAAFLDLNCENLVCRK